MICISVSGVCVEVYAVVSQAAQYPANWLFLHSRGCGESAYRFVVKDEEVMCSDAAAISGSIYGGLFDRARPCELQEKEVEATS